MNQNNKDGSFSKDKGHGRPVSVEALWDRAYNSMYSGDSDTAIELFRQLVAHYPGTEQAAKARKYIHGLLEKQFAQESYAEAEQKYDEACRYLDNGDVAKAVSHFKSVIKHFPNTLKAKDAAFQLNNIESRVNAFEQSPLSGSAGPESEWAENSGPKPVSPTVKKALVIFAVISLCVGLLWVGGQIISVFLIDYDRPTEVAAVVDEPQHDFAVVPPIAEPAPAGAVPAQPTPREQSGPTAQSAAERKARMDADRGIVPEGQREVRRVPQPQAQSTQPPAEHKRTRSFKTGDGYISVAAGADVDYDLPSGMDDNRNAIALIIGNSAYKKANWVKYALKDARTMKKYLIEVMGYREGNIFLVEDATQGDFALYFGNDKSYKGKLFNAVKPGKSDLFVYYTGHGAPSLKDHKGYFVPVEADPLYIELGGYSLEQFYRNLSRIPARSYTVVLDACFSGANVFDNVSPLVLEVKSADLKLDNAVILTSSAGSQVSSWYNEKEHGMFTYFFLKAMHNMNADANGDKVLTFDELYAYVSDNAEGVPYYARRLHGVEQNPRIQGAYKGKALIHYR